jgi:hypothetical protein
MYICRINPGKTKKQTEKSEKERDHWVIVEKEK